MILLPVEPGPPDGVYQNGFGSPIVLGQKVTVEEFGKEEFRSAGPQLDPNTNAPPLDGSSDTFM